MIGDGEPDEDFPALDRHRTLKQFGNVTECCLCSKKGATPPPMPTQAIPATPTKDLIPVTFFSSLFPFTNFSCYYYYYYYYYSWDRLIWY